MVEPEDRDCTLYIRLPFLKIGKYEDTKKLSEILSKSLGIRFNRNLTASTTHLDLEIRKNSSYEEIAEKRGDFIHFYLLLDIDPKLEIAWNTAVEEICGIILLIRQLGGNAVPMCDYEEEIYKNISRDPIF